MPEIALNGLKSTLMALDDPERIQSLALVNTFARFDPGKPGNAPPLALRMAVLGLLGLPAQARFVPPRLFPKPEQTPLRQIAAERIAANDLATYRRLLFAIREFNVTNRLSEIICPTLVIAGDRDTTVPLHAKTICTAGYACPQPDCDYFGNPAPTFHALVGDGQRAADGIQWRAYYHFSRPHLSLPLKLDVPQARRGKQPSRHYGLRTPAIACKRSLSGSCGRRQPCQVVPKLTEKLEGF